MNQEFRDLVEYGCRTADSFAKLYYATFDQRRHRIGSLYLTTAQFSWNGNGSQGAVDIEEFIKNLPKSRHQLATLDSQPILDQAVGGQNTFMIMASGTVKYEGQSTRNFQQSLIITSENDKWKIGSDCYRLQGSL